MPPIFEQTTSTLYYSNDGMLGVVREAHPDDNKLIVYVVQCGDEGRPVFATLDRVKADAYIAGYDLATQPA